MINIKISPTRTGRTLTIATRAGTHEDAATGQMVVDDIVEQRSVTLHLTNEQVHLLHHCLESGGGVDVSGEQWDIADVLPAHLP